MLNLTKVLLIYLIIPVFALLSSLFNHHVINSVDYELKSQTFNDSRLIWIRFLMPTLSLRMWLSSLLQRKQKDSTASGTAREGGSVCLPATILAIWSMINSYIPFTSV